ncbi:fimbrial protein [Escherichia coli]|uniref:fimbrial protein n=1 Tax=Escherichia coli TaxID=562 RepID=UPI001C40478B|nr:fimbrial protein [Escherichia coli]
MSKFVKTAIAATMVMGAFASTSTIAAGNNGTARFYGTIEDSPCSIVPDDHKLEVDMGDIGSGILKNNGTSTPKAFQIHLQDCVFDTQTTMTTTFTGNASATNSGNYYTIYNTDTGAAFNNVSLAIGDAQGTSYKSGMGINQTIVKDTATNKGKAKQTLDFKAWLVGAADAPDLGNFEANTTFQITYL